VLIKASFYLGTKYFFPIYHFAGPENQRTKLENYKAVLENAKPDNA